MLLPYEIIMNIFSFLDINKIAEIHLPITYFTQYIKLRLDKKSNLWINGIYNNLYNNCFLCKNILSEIHFMMICIKCEFILDDICKYPLYCLKCIQAKKIVRGKILLKSCLLCNNSRMVIAIAPY
tara:strand:+ start:698 stop:1072 length:375 start_codon:yes stop_codon:yes gene_type:complete